MSASTEDLLWDYRTYGFPEDNGDLSLKHRIEVLEDVVVKLLARISRLEHPVNPVPQDTANLYRYYDTEANKIKIGDLADALS